MLAFPSNHYKDKIRSRKSTPKLSAYNIKSVIIFVIHMDYDNDIMFEDYQKVCEGIHCFDYLRNIITKKNGKMTERNDIYNDELWDTKSVKYVEEKFY